ncbi:MAG: DUF2274 domain-containing protein [Alphaproteobacteria bacterium]|nr:DUF2274 domain-containing protein [Alphaproteobacteria bacterium]MDE2112218.1 DUF2274 domain-containing protein [Alphaproteobacteria bacterium]MDE2494150.1 DUF2274 domain-containing protein [Alphaproteobacteria bacterium]
MTDLKLRRLPDRVPVKITMTVDAQLHRLLQEYAAIYAKTYGATESVADLCPYMLQAFLESDRDFLKARKDGGLQGSVAASVETPAPGRRRQRAPTPEPGANEE